MSLTWTQAERAAYAARSGDFRALGAIDLIECADGDGRGARLLQFRTFAGLAGEIAVDRGFDIVGLTYRNINLAWHGPTCSRPAPVLADDFGLGLLRSFDGFLVTCGLDHYGVPASGPADHFIYPNRPAVQYPLHGRISSTPARLVGYGLDADGDQPTLWCEAVVRQASVFGEVLEMRRRIEIPLLGARIGLTDLVTNRGARPSRHGMLYHVNIGYPLLDDATTLVGVSADLAQDFARCPPRPHPDAVESFTETDLIGVAGEHATISVSNSQLRTRLALEIDRSTLPQFGVWRAYQSGIFALGLEPHTGLGAPDESYRAGHPDFIEPGAQRRYNLVFSAESF